MHSKAREQATRLASSHFVRVNSLSIVNFLSHFNIIDNCKYSECVRKPQTKTALHMMLLHVGYTHMLATGTSAKVSFIESVMTTNPA